MNKPLVATMTALLLVSACGQIRESRFNPTNWFGRTAAPTTLAPAGGYVAPVEDPRPLVDQITQMSVEPFPGGVIVRATALQPTQGWWDAALIPVNEARPVDGVVTFRFVAAPPPAPTRVSTPQSRELTAAVYVSDARLAGARQVTVISATGARSAGR